MSHRGKKHKRKDTSSLCSECRVIERKEFCFPEKNFQALNCGRILGELEFGVHDLDNADGEPTKFENAFPPGANPLSTNALYGWQLDPSTRPQKTVGFSFDVPAGMEGAEFLELLLE